MCLSKIKDYLKRDMFFCRKCGSFNLNYGHWTRGWNNLCGQATGANGWRCFDCGKIVWKQTDEEYAESLPEWCTPYLTKELKKAYGRKN